MLALLPTVIATLTATAPVGGAPVTPALVVPERAQAAATADDADAATIAGEVLTSAERVVAVHELAGAVAFDLIDDGARWQLTLALDDDGAVIDTALGPIPGPVAAGRAQVAPIRLARIERVDRDGRGRLILRDGARGRRVVIPGG